MEVRNATISDAGAIQGLINEYAERDRMLFRSLADIYENLQTFVVAIDGDSTVGCCSLDVIWADLAEIKSLAVGNDYRGKGVGRAMAESCIERAAKLGLPKVFALTLEPDFFLKLGFEVVDKEALPMKVWSDCARCPKQQQCDEIAVVKAV